jgi:SOS-response transcriptional repressor LexA
MMPRQGDVPLPFGLTALMRDCLTVIQELSEATGSSPSFAEIRRELGLSSMSQVARLIAALERRGHLARRPGHARTLTVLAPIPAPEEAEIELTRAGLVLVATMEAAP